MAKIKWGRLLAGAAIIGTAIAGGIAFFSKYKHDQHNLDDDFDDFEDDFEDEDLDEDTTDSASSREYVTIPKEPVASSEEEKEEPVEKPVQESEETPEDIITVNNDSSSEAEEKSKEGSI